MVGASMTTMVSLSVWNSCTCYSWFILDIMLLVSKWLDGGYWTMNHGGDWMPLVFVTFYVRWASECVNDTWLSPSSLLKLIPTSGVNRGIADIVSSSAMWALIWPKFILFPCVNGLLYIPIFSSGVPEICMFFSFLIFFPLPFDSSYLTYERWGNHYVESSPWQEWTPISRLAIVSCVILHGSPWASFMSPICLFLRLSSLMFIWFRVWYLIEINFHNYN